MLDKVLLEFELVEISSESELDLVEVSSRVGELMGIDGGSFGGVSAVHSSSESSAVRSKYAGIE